MAIISFVIKDGQKPGEEEIRQIKDAALHPFEYDSDCPPSDAKALAEFAKMARARIIKPDMPARVYES